MRTILVCLALTACSDVHAAPPTSDVRDVGAFHGVAIETVIDAEVTIGPATRVELRGPREWLAKVQTRVAGGVLVIAMTGTEHHVPKLHAIITTPALSSVRVSGVSDVHITRLAGTSLDAAVSGVGNLELSGRVGTLHVVLSGTGAIAARDLATHSADVTVSGTGDATVRASQEVDATVSGVGHVTVVGKPASVKRRVSGMGEIRVE